MTNTFPKIDYHKGSLCLLTRYQLARRINPATLVLSSETTALYKGQLFQFEFQHGLLGPYIYVSDLEGEYHYCIPKCDLIIFQQEIETVGVS